MNESDLSLRSLLSRHGSYPIIAAASASGQLTDFPVTLFEHIGDVYRRVETISSHDIVGIEALRLAALVHEEPRESIPELLRSAGLFEFAPAVTAVADGFGRIWKVRNESELMVCVNEISSHLDLILLFELAHEGKAIPAMQRAAEVSGLGDTFKRWQEQLGGNVS